MKKSGRCAADPMYVLGNHCEESKISQVRRVHPSLPMFVAIALFRLNRKKRFLPLWETRLSRSSASLSRHNFHYEHPDCDNHVRHVAYITYLNTLQCHRESASIPPTVLRSYHQARLSARQRPRATYIRVSSSAWAHEHTDLLHLGRALCTFSSSSCQHMVDHYGQPHVDHRSMRD